MRPEQGEARALLGYAELGRINPWSVEANLTSTRRCKHAHWGARFCIQAAIHTSIIQALGQGKWPLNDSPISLAQSSQQQRQKKLSSKLGLANICSLRYPSVSLSLAAFLRPAMCVATLSCLAITWMCGASWSAVLLLQLQTRASSAESFQFFLFVPCPGLATPTSLKD